MQGIEKIIDAAIQNKTFNERLIDRISELLVWLLLALAVVGVGLRWLLGPMFGAVVIAGLVGGGTWYVYGAPEIAVASGLLGFIFVLVGLANWIYMGVSSLSESGGGSSGFSGGGGGFGGGGASGSW